jgi:hypothetical protein
MVSMRTMPGSRVAAILEFARVTHCMLNEHGCLPEFEVDGRLHLKRRDIDPGAGAQKRFMQKGVE